MFLNLGEYVIAEKFLLFFLSATTSEKGTERTATSACIVLLARTSVLPSFIIFLLAAIFFSSIVFPSVIVCIIALVGCYKISIKYFFVVVFFAITVPYVWIIALVGIVIFIVVIHLYFS